MKKIYFSILSVLFITSVSNAQLSLTKAFNEPVIGDINITHHWDSTAALSNNNGPNTLWDFSALTSNTAVSISNYTSVASTPSASTYPNATFAEDGGNGSYNYYKSSGTAPSGTLEILGIIQPSLSINFNSNSVLVTTWPIAYSYNKTDAFSGTVAAQTPSGNVTGNASGNIHTIASGSGTLILPGNLTFTNVLQVYSTQTINISVLFGAVTATIVNTTYQYYYNTQKFPILTVNYQNLSGAFSGNTGSIEINNNIIAGIHESALSGANLNLYPNPASNQLNISLDNTKTENVSVRILNNLGQLVKITELGNSANISSQIDISGLNSGVYFVKTTVGAASATSKLIKE